MSRGQGPHTSRNGSRYHGRSQASNVLGPRGPRRFFGRLSRGQLEYRGGGGQGSGHHGHVRRSLVRGRPLRLTSNRTGQLRRDGLPTSYGRPHRSNVRRVWYSSRNSRAKRGASGRRGRPARQVGLFFMKGLQFVTMRQLSLFHVVFRGVFRYSYALVIFRVGRRVRSVFYPNVFSGHVTSGRGLQQSVVPTTRHEERRGLYRRHVNFLYVVVYFRSVNVFVVIGLVLRSLFSALYIGMFPAICMPRYRLVTRPNPIAIVGFFIVVVLLVSYYGNVLLVR